MAGTESVPVIICNSHDLWALSQCKYCFQKYWNLDEYESI